MKIVEVINSLSYRGGAQVFFCDLCNKLQNNPDLELHVILLYDKIHNSFNFIKSSPRIKFYTLNKKRSLDFNASKELKRIIESINPDIINYHLPFLSTYFFAFGFRKTSWVLLKTFHSIPGFDTNSFELFLEKKYVKAKKLAFVGISKKITEIAKIKYPNALIKTITNGIDVRNKITKVEKKYTFICVASFTPVKNHELLFKAFSMHLIKNPNDTLLCVGGGELLDNSINYIKTNNLEKNVFFIGQVDDVYSYLAESKIFILTSLREGYPISILEAMNFGLPIIAPAIGGIPDMVCDGINGILFEKNNVSELTNAMINVKRDLTFYSENNSIKSLEFDINNTVNEYIKYYILLKNYVIK